MALSPAIEFSIVDIQVANAAIMRIRAFFTWEDITTDLV